MTLMRVDMYSIGHGYGFCMEESGPRVFFRVEDFDGRGGVLPIPGEPVEVQNLLPSEGRSPRASAVRRLHVPTAALGTVLSFDVEKGWGFVECGGVTYFLHRSDLLEKFVPVVGSTLSFYPGIRRNKPRACYVKQTGTVGGV